MKILIFVDSEQNTFEFKADEIIGSGTYGPMISLEFSNGNSLDVPVNEWNIAMLNKHYSELDPDYAANIDLLDAFNQEELKKAIASAPVSKVVYLDEEPAAEIVV